MGDYAEVEKRLKRAVGRSLRRLCSLQGMNWWWLEIPPRSRACASIALTGGIHGDEPAGVEALLRFLESPRPSWAASIRFLIFPCMNPYGFQNNHRHNYAGLDINRQYRATSVPEVEAQKRVLRGQRFDLHISFHEDVDARGFYIYELSRNSHQIAAEILHNISPIIPFDSRGRIEGRRARDGLIRRNFRPDRRKRWPEAFYLFAHHTDHILTTETPGPFAFEKRVKAQSVALATACRFVRKMKN